VVARVSAPGFSSSSVTRRGRPPQGRPRAGGPSGRPGHDTGANDV